MNRTTLINLNKRRILGIACTSFLCFYPPLERIRAGAGKFENFLFVHAGFNNEIENPFDDSYHMIWKCREKYDHPMLKDVIILHGHCAIPYSISEDRIRTGNPVVNIDTGCVYGGHTGYGRLTALELYSRDIYFV